MPVSQDTGIFYALFKVKESRSQSGLFLLSLDELVLEDHLVRVIEAYIPLLNLRSWIRHSQAHGQGTSLV